MARQGRSKRTPSDRGTVNRGRRPDIIESKKLRLKDRAPQRDRKRRRLIIVGALILAGLLAYPAARGAGYLLRKALIERDRPLMQAVERNLTEIVKLLVKGGANVNARNENGDTALIQAIRNGNRDIIQYLLEQDANVNARGAFGNTPLIVAAAADRVETARSLVARKAKLNLRNGHKDTALFQAVRSEATRTAVVTLAEGAAGNPPSSGRHCIP